MCYSPWGCKESDTAKRLTHLRSNTFKGISFDGLGLDQEYHLCYCFPHINRGETMKEKELATRQKSGQRPCEGTVRMEGDAQTLSELKSDACSLLSSHRDVGLWIFRIPPKH